MSETRGSFNGFARHRKAAGLPGGDRADVARKCAADAELRALILEARYDEADARWESNNRPRADRPASGAPARTPAPAPALTVDDAEASAARADPAPVDVDYQEARRRREYWTSEGERLKVLERRGELIPADEARKIVDSGARAIRNGFEAAVEQAFPSLHAASGMDMMEARRWLLQFVRDTLTRIADAGPVADVE